MHWKIVIFLFAFAMPGNLAIAQIEVPVATNNEIMMPEEETIPPMQIIQPFYDADSILIGTYHYSGKDLDSTIYVKPNKKKLKVLFKMPEYRGGYDSLKLFFEEEFQKIEKKEELNGLSLVYILLEKGKITDIRIGDRIAYNNYDINYDKEIKKIIRKTERNWITQSPGNEGPILFVYLFQLN